ncbi:MAG: phosphatase PAP2 family protein [Halodesulfurarchaeum sp.]
MLDIPTTREGLSGNMLWNTITPEILPVSALLIVGSVAIIGRERLFRFANNYRQQLRSAAPAIATLGGLLVLNQLFREVGTELSWLIGWNITGAIYEIEGGFVGWLQFIIPEIMTPLFGAIYMVGYVFLLVFPVIAYLVLRDHRFLRETAFAYSINHVLGLVLYVTIIAYGPRNIIPDLVEPLLYITWPESQIVTSEVNTNTNVFPSLHTSMSVTVALLAYRTRDIYPVWFPIASVLAVGVVISTMYLGIHWGIDVLAGTALAVIAIKGSQFIDARWARRVSDC